ncbi:MAG: AsmA family protein [bacterium]|nr:AsmA family protein [bacterium]
MKKFWMISGIVVASILLIIYIGFLFVLPNVVDINKFKPEVQKIAKEQANLAVNFENAKIITTPLLGLGVKADDISVKLPDKSVLFSADSLKTRIALPSLFLLTVKVSCFEVEKPFVNLEIVNNQQYKVISLVEDILNSEKEAKLEAGKTPEYAECWFNPAWIRIKVPNVKLKNYEVLVNDIKGGHYLKLTGEQLKVGYFNGKTAKISTYAELFSDENKNITANIDLNTFLPKPAPALDEEDDRAERVEIPFCNAVSLYRTYNPKMDINTKLKVRVRNNRIVSRGYFNLENFTMNVHNLTIPKSYVKLRMSGATVFADTDINVAKDQNIQLLGKFNYGNHLGMDMDIKTADIRFESLLRLGEAFLNSLNVKHELANYTATGTFKSDCHVRTNFKKLRSSGSVIVKGGGVNVKGFGKVLSGANINILLDNNVLNIKESTIFVNNSKIYINGSIDEKSVADISVKTDKIPLSMLFNSFAPRELRNQYNFRSGDLLFEATVIGKLKKAVCAVKTGLENFDFSDRGGLFTIKDKSMNADFVYDSKELSGIIENNGLMFGLPKTDSLISIPKFETEIAKGDITVKENKIMFNNNSVYTYYGSVINYVNPKSINFVLSGMTSTADIMKFIGKDLSMYFHQNGTIPVKLTFDGDNKKQTMFFQVLTDGSNFFTPIDFQEVAGKNISLQSVIDFKGNRIKIKKTGFYDRVVTVDEKGNEQVALNEILGVDGTIAGNRINLLKITMPKELNGKIYVFPKSKLKLNGKAFVFGDSSNPRLRGKFEVSELSIPEIMTEIDKAGVKLRGDMVDFYVENLLANGTDVNLKGFFKLIQNGLFTISNLDFNSKYINLDKLMQVTDKMMKYVPASSETSSSTPAQTADIPLVLQRGHIDIDRIITGNINVLNTHSLMRLRNNVFYLDNLRTNIFNGNARGNISVNLLSMLIKLNMNGRNIDVDKAMADAAGMNGMLSGNADFNADIEIRGATMEEQMRNLKGNVDFVVTDGQFGPFGKLENLIIAENIRESQFFQTAIGGMLNNLLTIDTTHFSELKGVLCFENGICHIDPLTSSGNVLALHVFGQFDLLQNRADMKVRAKMSSLLSNLLGPLNAINPVNLVNSAASLNVVTAKAFSLFCETVSADELAILPSFSNKYVDDSATKFQIVVRGDVAKPLTLVKSFKWLATPLEFQRAEEFAEAIPEPIEGSTATTVEELMAEQQALQAEKETVGYKVKSIISKDWADRGAAKEALKETSKSNDKENEKVDSP